VRFEISAANVKVFRFRVTHTHIGSTENIPIIISVGAVNAEIYDCLAHNRNSQNDGDKISWSINQKVYLKGCSGRNDSTRNTASVFHLNFPGIVLEECIAEGVSSSAAIGFYFNNHARLLDCITNLPGATARSIFGFAGHVQIEGGTFLSGSTGIDLSASAISNYDIRGITITAPFLNLGYPRGGNCNIKTFNQSTASVTGITVVGGELVLENANFLNNSSRDILLSGNSKLIGKDISFGSAPVSIDGVNGTIFDNNQAHVVDYNNAIGSWKSWQPNGFAELTSQISRSEGEENFSIRMRYTSTGPYVNNKNLPLELGINGHETIWIPLNAGVNIFTMYCTGVGFDAALTDKDLWMEFDYLNLPSGSNR